MSKKCLPNTSEVGNTHDANSKNHANCITVVGSLNADLYYTMKNLPLAGETVDGIAANIGPGGMYSITHLHLTPILCYTYRNDFVT